MDTNVTLRSNVYINKSKRNNDLDFVHHIRDYNSLLRYYDPVYRSSDVPLTEIQYEILKHGPPRCSLETGTMSWGVPSGSDRFVCRCEEKDCPRYAVCSADTSFERIIRNPEEEEPPVTETPLADSIEKSSIPEEELCPDNVLEETQNTVSETMQLPISPPSEQEDKLTADLKSVARKSQNILCVSQEAIIEADINSWICVDAGPGTGKTYMVIKRLKKLIETGNFEQAILVLCFSQNAVQVIRERLRLEIGGSLDDLIADERLVIRTFDSFATYMLADDLPKGLNYDQRIELFIKKMTEQPALLDSVEYLIVDEVQDTIGVRARMLKAMIEQSRFGVLLLGDRCQAIYDWSIRSADDWTSADLFEWISSCGFQVYELEKNHRQELAVSRIGDAIRRSLLNSNEEEQEQTLTLCKEKIETLWPGCDMQELSQKLLQQSELILCKTNGEAAAMSDLLFGGCEFVEHTVMQNANHKSLAPWIGMVLGGLYGPYSKQRYFYCQGADI